ncbi:Exodeoxyribonuclease III [Candidatus Moranella endobia PCVAL]|uniref:Exonuclease III n=1 Tax=Moranella endobia (strain PCIT) TaxID=903503 RepID=F7XY73_MOREP|nr:exodeoxyribonuclease III [Candidatus Moranella endobia]AEI75049.1 exonuclease III [Candidatus Moranella endobia PCIT]AGJ61297.1 Exodeoxyribonuclease III [Candidatus Moranella endobia PCVAL]
MKVVSFNINGIRARPHQLEAIITKLQPDLIGLQETKVNDDLFPLEALSRQGYNAYYYGQKGQYGVALLSREKLFAIRRGFNTAGNESQRRIIMADLITPKGLLTVVNGYFPQGENRSHPVKFTAKERFYHSIQKYIEQNHQRESMLLIMGDMNISPTNLDLGISEESRKRWLRTGKCSFLPEERVWMERLLSWGLIDTYRQANPLGDKRYSWFNYRSRGFNENRGLRIDLLLASRPLAALMRATGIDYTVRAMNKPSDHAPVWADFDV